MNEAHKVRLRELYCCILWQMMCFHVDMRGSLPTPGNHKDWCNTKTTTTLGCPQMGLNMLCHCPMLFNLKKKKTKLLAWSIYWFCINKPAAYDFIFIIGIFVKETWTPSTLTSHRKLQTVLSTVWLKTFDKASKRSFLKGDQWRACACCEKCG